MKKIQTEYTKNREVGKRLAKIRKAKGFTQISLAKELGISHRMVAYYEAQTDFPPAALLPKIAKILKTTTDEILGLKPVTDNPKNGKLYKKLKQAENLSPKSQKQIIEYINVLEKAEKK